MWYEWYLQQKLMWTDVGMRWKQVINIGFVVLVLLVSVYDDPKAGVYLSFLSFSFLDISKLKHQCLLDAQMWLVAPMSFRSRMLRLQRSVLFDLKFFLVLSLALVFLLQQQFELLGYFVGYYFAYGVLTCCLISMARRLAMVSVLIKILYNLPIAASLLVLISRFRAQREVLLELTVNPYGLALMLGLAVISLCLLPVFLRRYPFSKADVVHNYNRKYWY